MSYLGLYIIVPLAFTLLGLVFLIIDLVNARKFNFTFNTKKGILNCLSLALVLAMIPLLYTGLHNFHEENIRDVELAKENKDTVKKTSPVFVPKSDTTTIKVTSNLPPLFNKLLADNLKRRFPHTTTHYIKLDFSCPTDGFKHTCCGGTLMDYDPGALVQVKSACGDFPIEGDLISPFGKNKPSEVDLHLQSELRRIVRENINKICNNLESCMN